MLLKIKEIEYADDKLLGEGWFGAVYKGRCSSYQGEIAVKKVKIDYIDQETKEDELKNLNHPNVVRLFDTASDNSYR